eukprot:scaffold1620_cov233-Pinguiococcus_pyrenoidosus.AAC.16
MLTRLSFVSTSCSVADGSPARGVLHLHQRKPETLEVRSVLGLAEIRELLTVQVVATFLLRRTVVSEQREQGIHLALLAAVANDLEPGVVVGHEKLNVLIAVELHRLGPELRIESAAALDLLRSPRHQQIQSESSQDLREGVCVPRASCQRHRKLNKLESIHTQVRFFQLAVHGICAGGRPLRSVRFLRFLQALLRPRSLFPSRGVSARSLARCLIGSCIAFRTLEGLDAACRFLCAPLGWGACTSQRAAGTDHLGEKEQAGLPLLPLLLINLQRLRPPLAENVKWTLLEPEQVRTLLAHFIHQGEDRTVRRQDVSFDLVGLVALKAHLHDLLVRHRSRQEAERVVQAHFVVLRQHLPHIHRLEALAQEAGNDRLQLLSPVGALQEVQRRCSRPTDAHTRTGRPRCRHLDASEDLPAVHSRCRTALAVLVRGPFPILPDGLETCLGPSETLEGPPVPLQHLFPSLTRSGDQLSWATVASNLQARLRPSTSTLALPKEGTLLRAKNAALRRTYHVVSRERSRSPLHRRRAHDLCRVRDPAEACRPWS